MFITDLLRMRDSETDRFHFEINLFQFFIDSDLRFMNFTNHFM